MKIKQIKKPTIRYEDISMDKTPPLDKIVGKKMNQNT